MTAESVATELVTEEEWIDLLKRFDTDLDARVRALAVDPNARGLVSRINRAGESLLSVPMPATVKESAAAQQAAERAKHAARQRRDAALEAWRLAKSEHEAAQQNCEQAREATAKLRQPFRDFLKHVPGIGRIGLTVLHDALAARGIRVQGDNVILPE